MFKAIIYLNIIFSIIIFCSGKRRKKENVKEQAISESNDHLKFYSNISIDIRLYQLPTWNNQDDAEHNSTRSSTGVIEVIIPQASYSQFLCFPHSFAEFYQAYLFAHITCRKLGFMTLVSISGEEFPSLLSESRYHGMKLDSYSCFDQEQIISRCRWNAISIKSCQNVTKVICGGCQNVAKGFSGVIRSPGFPYVSLNDVTCEWKVSVPAKHSIYLSFNNFEELEDETEIIPCSVHQPYIEIMYGIQSKVTVNRFCRFKEMTNMSIPFNTVKILIFTGISLPKDKFSVNEKKGFSITFKAIPDEEELGSPLKVVLVSLLGLIFVTCTVVCRYVQKHKMCDCCLPKTVKSAHEVDTVQDLRCENNAPGKDIQVDRKMLKSTSGFSCNTLKEEKVSCKPHSSLEIPKSSTQIAMQNFPDGKRTEGAGWRTETEALRRHSPYTDPNKLSVAAPHFYDSVNRDRSLWPIKEISPQEHRRKQGKDVTLNEPFFSVVSSFFK